MSSAATIEREVTGDGDVAAAPAPVGRSRRRIPSMSAVFGACFALFAWAVQLRPLQDNSFLWHLKTGHWIIGHGIPRGDIFSFTAPNAPWVVQSWLAEVAYATIDNIFGPFGLRVFRAVVSALIAYLVYRLASRLTGERARAAMLTTAALAVSFTLWSERPLLLGVLGMVILVWIVEIPDCLAGRRAAVTLPVLMWTWANVHGTFALGFAYLCAHLLGRWLDGALPWQGPDRRLLVGSAAALAACMVNPLGISLLLFPIHLPTSTASSGCCSGSGLPSSSSRSPVPGSGRRAAISWSVSRSCSSDSGLCGTSRSLPSSASPWSPGPWPSTNSGRIGRPRSIWS